MQTLHITRANHRDLLLGGATTEKACIVAYTSSSIPVEFYCTSKKCSSFGVGCGGGVEIMCSSRTRDNDESKSCCVVSVKKEKEEKKLRRGGPPVVGQWTCTVAKPMVYEDLWH